MCIFRYAIGTLCGDLLVIFGATDLKVLKKFKGTPKLFKLQTKEREEELLIKVQCLFVFQSNQLDSVVSPLCYAPWLFKVLVEKKSRQWILPLQVPLSGKMYKLCPTMPNSYI